MNLKDLSRPLEISDVDFRVQSINNGGYATILAYKDARVDMNRLDEVLGPLGWQRDYKLIDGKLFCGVGVFNNHTDSWVWKWDVGTESNTEAEKGQASDAFKRACFNLGIGRELYSYPVISVKLKADEWEKEPRPKQTYNLKIKEWRWYSEFDDNGRISFLAAKDQNGEVRFKWGTMKPKNVEPSYATASGGEPIVQAEEKDPPVEEGNVQAILKKPAEVDTERLEAVSDYERMFGKKPHGRMSTETILNEINVESERRLAQESEEVSTDESDEDDEAVSELVVENVPSVEPIEEEDGDEGEIIDTIYNQFDEIEKYKDASEFVKWAKETVSKYIDIDAEETIEEFKAVCNNHYQKINS